MATDRYVEYDLKSKTATQHIEDYGFGIDGDWFNDRCLGESISRHEGSKPQKDVVTDFAERIAQLIVKWKNKPVKVDAEYVMADGTRKYENREVTFTDLKLTWETIPYGNGMEMGIFLNGVRPLTGDELQGLEIQEQNSQAQRRVWRQAEYDKLKAEFEN